MSVQKGRVTRYPVIQLAKLVLWALQDNRVASAWRPCDNHVCGAVANKHWQEKDKEKQKIGHNCDITPLPSPSVLTRHPNQRIYRVPS
jgi:hypothetical protein